MTIETSLTTTTTTTTTTTLHTSPSKTIFFNLIPTAAIAFAVAALVAPAPRSVVLIVVLAMSAVILRLSAWVTYKDQQLVVQVVEQVEYSYGVNDDTKQEEGNNGSGTTPTPAPAPMPMPMSAATISSIELYNILQSVMRPSPTIITILYASTFTYTTFLLIRLFSVNNFGGVPQQLDYGPKVSKDGPAGKTNIAFETLNFDTLGHFIQGLFCAVLSFPAVVGFLSNVSTKVIQFVRVRVRLWRYGNVNVDGNTDAHPDAHPDAHADADTGSTSSNKKMGCYSSSSSSSIVLETPCFVTLGTLHLLCTALTYYPFYSMVKRLRYSSFAQTSHLNNTTEWCLGFILGISLGSLISSLILHQFIIIVLSDSNNDDGDDDDDQGGRRRVIKTLTVQEDAEDRMKVYSYGRASDYKGVMKYTCLFPLVEYASLANLVLFAITTLSTGVNIGLSWNYKDDNTANIPILALYICLYAVIYSIFYILSRWN